MSSTTETLLARVEVQGQEEPAEVRSPLPGIVKKRLLEDGAEVNTGDAVLVLGPDATHVYEALRALYLVGKLDDVDFHSAVSAAHGKLP